MKVKFKNHYIDLQLVSNIELLDNKITITDINNNIITYKTKYNIVPQNLLLTDNDKGLFVNRNSNEFEDIVNGDYFKVNFLDKIITLSKDSFVNVFLKIKDMQNQCFDENKKLQKLDDEKSEKEFSTDCQKLIDMWLKTKHNIIHYETNVI